MFRLLEGATPFREEDAERYVKRGWWRELPVGALLDEAADIHPDKEAFIDLTTRLTYGQTRERANRLAIALMGLGVRSLDRVLVQLPNWTEFVPIYFALQKIGAIPLLLIDRYRQLEVGQLAELSGASSWIVPLRHGKVDYLPIIHDVLEAHPSIERVITVRGEVNEPGFWSFERLIADKGLSGADAARLEECSPDPRQVAHMGPTGGTTGAPKIVPRTHNGLVCTIEFCAKAWQQHCEDVNMIVGSVGHDLSFTKGFLASVFTQGTLVMLDTTDMRAVCEAIQREKVTAIVWVPTLAQRLLDYEALEDYDVGSLEKMHCGGGAAHSGLVRDVFNRLDARFYNGYGGTEGMNTICRPVDDVDTVCSTVGRPACPGDIYKVVDLQGNRLPPDTPGELLVKGPSVFSGYYRKPDENEKVFDQDGFFKTGDVATISPKGYVTITGRLKEMINRGGESISATMIEGLIIRHPEVAAAAVVAMPDPVMGERVCAYVQPNVGAALSFEEIVAFLRGEKASVLALPERIEFIQAMPYTAVGKLDKNALRDDIRSKLAAEAQEPAPL